MSQGRRVSRLAGYAPPKCMFIDCLCAVTVVISSRHPTSRPDHRVCDLILGRQLPALYTIEGCSPLHLFRRELPCNCTHLLIDVIMADSLRERSQLAFDVRWILAGERWCADLIAARSVTSRAGGDTSFGVASEYQTRARIALSEAATALRHA